MGLILATGWAIRYIGNGMITLTRNRPTMISWTGKKEFNTQVNKIRYVIEQVIANLKTWRITHTDYPRPLATFITTISAVIALNFYAAAQ